MTTIPVRVSPRPRRTVPKPPVYQSGKVTPGHIATWTTDGVIQDGGSVPSGGTGTPANPTATASNVAVNGTATTYMRSDAAPAVQLGSASQFGLVKADGTTITASGGVLTAIGGSGELGVVNVRDFGAVGQDRTYTNLVGGSGYTGGSATNQCTHPENASAWSAVNVTVTGGIIDVRGNPLASSITETTTANAVHSISDAITSTTFGANAAIRIDVELKPGLRDWVQIVAYDGSSLSFVNTFQLTGAGVVGSPFGFAGAEVTKATITALSNGWYRCMIEGNYGGGTGAVKPFVQTLLGDLLYFDSATDPTQFYTGDNSSPALYVGQCRIYAVQKYLGATYLAGDNIFYGVPLTGGAGNGEARANITVGLGQVLDVESVCPGQGDLVGDTKSCAAADIGGTGSGFSCQVATIGDDTDALQAALDAYGGGASSTPVTIDLPPGQYNIFPRNSLGSHALYLYNSNIRIRGAGRDSTTIRFFVSGGRFADTSYDFPTTPPGGAHAGYVWRGCAFFLPLPIKNIEFRSLRLTGGCVRHNNRYPLVGGGDPAPIGLSHPLGTFGDGDGWDTSNHAIGATALASPNRIQRIGVKIDDCEIDSFKGELIADESPQVAISDLTVPFDVTNWSYLITNSYIHDTPADILNTGGHTKVVGCELAWGTNGIESETTSSHLVMLDNYIHDCTHGIAPVVGVDSGAAITGTALTILKRNLIQRCGSAGIILFNFQVNTLIEDNDIVDCGPAAVSGGAIALALLGGSQTYANIIIRNNSIWLHERFCNVGISIGLGAFSSPFLKGIFVEDNRAMLTPNAQLIGAALQTPMIFNVGPGCEVEVSRNDFRLAAGNFVDSGLGGVVHRGLRNIWNGGTNFPEVRRTDQFDKTDNTLANTTLAETMSDQGTAWFEIFLMISAPAGGAKVALAASGGSVFSTQYDVEAWDASGYNAAASGQSTSFGASFGSNAAITKIKITGTVLPNAGSPLTMTVQFAQNTTNGTPSSVLTGSWMKVRIPGV